MQKQTSIKSLSVTEYDTCARKEKESFRFSSCLYTLLIPFFILNLFYAPHALYIFHKMPETAINGKQRQTITKKVEQTRVLFHYKIFGSTIEMFLFYFAFWLSSVIQFSTYLSRAVTQHLNE